MFTGGLILGILWYLALFQKASQLQSIGWSEVIKFILYIGRW